MRVELSPEEVEKKKEQKNIETSVKSSKYEKDWEFIVERLIQALKDENKYVRRGAAGALGELGDLEAVEPLTEASKDKDSNVREMAIWALKKIGNRV
ncbi:MAG: HEAT repeat domain-containing protein [Candidatus Freyarchaeum deiterrae]